MARTYTRLEGEAAEKVRRFLGLPQEDGGMDREKIEARKAELRKALTATEQQALGIRGALQDCDYWLGELAKAEQAEKPIAPQE